MFFHSSVSSAIHKYEHFISPVSVHLVVGNSKRAKSYLSGCADILLVGRCRTLWSLMKWEQINSMYPTYLRQFVLNFVCLHFTQLISRWYVSRKIRVEQYDTSCKQHKKYSFQGPLRWTMRKKDKTKQEPWTGPDPYLWKACNWMYRLRAVVPQITRAQWR